ncbi:DUF4232 domain-containing protein [Streptomyces sp. NPDC052496]|uniref:DUF4232 domain-containing protein n=1 Tax=Streptomyces sp. NPDC052496 TaxID=3154951 RepID=UPI003430048D
MSPFRAPSGQGRGETRTPSPNRGAARHRTRGPKTSAGATARTNTNPHTNSKTDTKAGTADRQAGSSQATRSGKTSSGIQRCDTSDLDAVFATGEDGTPDPNANGSTTTSIALTNTGSRTCKIGGFPGITLQPDADGPVRSLAHSSAKHGSITLQPGDSTDFTINLSLARENEEDFGKPATVTATPPDEPPAPWQPSS